MTKFEAARKHKPLKPMKKLNWVKVSHMQASSDQAMWAKSVRGDMDTKVSIDPGQVEELFSRAEIKKVVKTQEDKEKPKQSSVVRTTHRGESVIVFPHFVWTNSP